MPSRIPPATAIRGQTEKGGCLCLCENVRNGPNYSRGPGSGQLSLRTSAGGGETKAARHGTSQHLGQSRCPGGRLPETHLSGCRPSGAQGFRRPVCVLIRFRRQRELAPVSFPFLYIILIAFLSPGPCSKQMLPSSLHFGSHGYYLFILFGGNIVTSRRSNATGTRFGGEELFRYGDHRGDRLFFPNLRPFAGLVKSPRGARITVVKLKTSLRSRIARLTLAVLATLLQRGADVRTREERPGDILRQAGGSSADGRRAAGRRPFKGRSTRASKEPRSWLALAQGTQWRSVPSGRRADRQPMNQTLSQQGGFWGGGWGP